MYEILKNPPKMSRDEICEKYDGKWLFVVQRRDEPFQPYKNEIPVVVADTAWEGDDDGIYDVYYNDPNLATVGHLSLLPEEENTFFGFWEVPVDDCD